MELVWAFVLIVCWSSTLALRFWQVLLFWSILFSRRLVLSILIAPIAISCQQSASGWMELIWRWNQSSTLSTLTMELARTHVNLELNHSILVFHFGFWATHFYASITRSLIVVKTKLVSHWLCNSNVFNQSINRSKGSLSETINQTVLCITHSSWRWSNYSILDIRNWFIALHYWRFVV